MRKHVSQGEVQSKGGGLSFVQCEPTVNHCNIPNCVAWLYASAIPFLNLSAFRLGLFDYLLLLLLVR
jgi:hypothetical protein